MAKNQRYSGANIRSAIRGLKTQEIMQVSEMALDNPDVIPLWYGESDVKTPAFICDAAATAMGEGYTFYTHKRGLPELREALADYSQRLYGLPVGVDRITVTSSGMTAIMIAMQVVIDPGDRVVLVGPVWPNAEAAVKIMGGEVCQHSLRHEDDEAQSWHLDIEHLFAMCTANTRAIFINSPGNPTGWMMSTREQKEILEFCRLRNIWIIADEVYSRIVYDRPAAPSFLEIIEPEDSVLVVNSFSKNWAMTGWRLGWLTHPPSFAKPFSDLIEFNTSGTPAFLQKACITALKDGEHVIADMVDLCREGRDIVGTAMSEWPRVRYRAPEAAFYAFFALDGMENSLKFAKQLVLDVGVGLAPGTAFGPEGDGWLRLCFARDSGELSIAMDRLANVFA